jgi:hypothetical protein
MSSSISLLRHVSQRLFFAEQPFSVSSNDLFELWEGRTQSCLFLCLDTSDELSYEKWSHTGKIRRRVGEEESW